MEIAEDSRKFLERVVNKTDVKLSRMVVLLSETLEEYGFEGEINLHLTVTVKVGNTVLERLSTSNFRR